MAHSLLPSSSMPHLHRGMVLHNHTPSHWDVRDVRMCSSHHYHIDRSHVLSPTSVPDMLTRVGLDLHCSCSWAVSRMWHLPPTTYKYTDLKLSTTGLPDISLRDDTHDKYLDLADPVP